MKPHHLIPTLACAMMLSCSTTNSSDVQSGRESGGQPPAPDSTFIKFSGTVADGILETSDWQTLQAAISTFSDDQVCATAHMEENGNLTMLVVGAKPSEIRQKLPEDFELETAEMSLSEHSGYCASMQTLGMARRHQRPLWDVLASVSEGGAQVHPHYQAESITCQKSSAAPATCLVESGSTIKTANQEASEDLYAHLSTKLGYRPLAGLSFYLKDVMCSTRELVGPPGGAPFTIQQLCGFTTGTNRYLGYEPLTLQEKKGGTAVIFQDENLAALKNDAAASSLVECTESACSVTFLKDIIGSGLQGYGRYFSGAKTVAIVREAAEALFHHLPESSETEDFLSRTRKDQTGKLSCSVRRLENLLPWHNRDAVCELQL